MLSSHGVVMRKAPRIILTKVKLVYIHLNPGKEIGDVCDE
jgi:hypothetical protein